MRDARLILSLLQLAIIASKLSWPLVTAPKFGIVQKEKKKKQGGLKCIIRAMQAALAALVTKATEK